MNKILFDTDVMIAHLRDYATVTSQIAELHQKGCVLAYTPVSEAEIFRGLRSNERKRTENFLNQLVCLSLDQRIGRLAGEYLRRYSKSHGLEIPDALIAASAVIHRFALCTFNWKHYPMSEIERFHLDH